MYHNRILLEVFCMKGCDEHCGKEFPSYCSTLGKFPKYSCLLNNCPYVTFTSLENALCYVNNESESENTVEWNPNIFVDNPNLLQKWQEVANKKMDEAQNEFSKMLEKTVLNTGDGSLC